MRFILLLSPLLSLTYASAAIKYNVIQTVENGCNVGKLNNPGIFDTTLSGALLIKCAPNSSNTIMDFTFHNPSQVIFKAFATFDDNCDGTVDSYFSAFNTPGYVFNEWVNFTGIPCGPPSYKASCCIYVDQSYGVYYYTTRVYARSSPSPAAPSIIGTVLGIIFSLVIVPSCGYFLRMYLRNQRAKAVQSQIQHNPIVLGMPMQPVQPGQYGNYALPQAYGQAYGQPQPYGQPQAHGQPQPYGQPPQVVTPS